MNKKYEFLRYMAAILDGYKAGWDDPDSKVKKARIKQSRWAYKKCRKMFCDKNENLRRWLDDKPCVFVSQITGVLIEIDIGKDLDALFHFLEFCRRQNNNEPIDDADLAYLAFLITKSQSMEDNNIK